MKVTKYSSSCSRSATAAYPQSKSWKEAYSSYGVSVNEAWTSYQSPRKQVVEIERFAAIATQYDIPAEVIRAEQYYTNIYYATKWDWFTALPEEIQSIKLAEADAPNAIAEGREIAHERDLIETGNSKLSASRETGRAALGVLAVIAFAAVMFRAILEVVLGALRSDDQRSRVSRSMNALR